MGMNISLYKAVVLTRILFKELFFDLDLWSKNCLKVTTHLLSEVWAQLDQREWKYAVDKWKKTDEDKLVQGHWTSFTHRHSMKFELYLAKWRENMHGQWFYTERFLTLNFDTKNWCKVTTNPLPTNSVWVKFEPYLSKRRKNTCYTAKMK